MITLNRLQLKIDNLEWTIRKIEDYELPNINWKRLWWRWWFRVDLSLRVA
jgi:hypothetical protein